MATKRVKIEAAGTDSGSIMREIEAAVPVRGTTRTRVKKPYEDVANKGPDQIDAQEAGQPFVAVPGKSTSKSRLKAAIGASKMPAGLDPEKAMRDAQAVAPEKPKRARKPKVTAEAPVSGIIHDPPGEVEPGDEGLVEALDGQGQPTGYASTVFTMEESHARYSEQVFGIPKDAHVSHMAATEGDTGESPTKPVFEVLERYRTVKAPFHTDAPYTVVVKGQTGSLRFEERDFGRAIDEAKQFHIATARRVSVLRPGMKAVHYYHVKDFNEMRARELVQSMLAGQARADAERRMRPQVVQSHVKPQYGRRTRDDYQHDTFC